MTESSGNGTADALSPVAPSHSFPIARLLLSFGFGILAWLVFWAILILAVVQFVLLAVNGHINEDLKTFCRSLIQYLAELLAYVVFARDDQPFPVGSFPRNG